MCCFDGELKCHCIKPNVCCKSAGNICCIDQRCAFPCDKEVPMEIGCLSVMCYSPPKAEGMERR